MSVYELACRAFQGAARLGRRLWPWREPVLLRGPGSVLRLPSLIKSLGLRRVLLVTDPGLMRLGLPRPLVSALEKAGLFCVVYDQTAANPTPRDIEEARRLCVGGKCQCVIGFGGGSPMDCAKMACLLAAYPSKKAHRMKGVQPLRLRKIPTLIAVPTAAGSGAEAAIAAVMTDPETKMKYSVISPRLRPKYAVLDPALTLGLPPRLTAQAGMGALARAAEAFLSRGRTRDTDARAREAVRLIFDNLETAHAEGRGMAARDAMLHASYCAGLAFTKARAGYVHGIAHALGGLYCLPHALACAVTLPHVLEAYGPRVHARLAELYDAAGLAQPDQSGAEKAEAFIHTLRLMNTSMGIPAKFTCIREEDVPKLAARVLKESNPLYPVPRIWRQAACEEVVRGMKSNEK